MSHVVDTGLSTGKIGITPRSERQATHSTGWRQQQLPHAQNKK